MVIRISTIARALRDAPRGSRLPLFLALAPFILTQAEEPATVDKYEFQSLEDYPSIYARLANLLGLAERTPGSGELNFLHSIQNHHHQVGAIGLSESLFLTAMASILAPPLAVEIGTSSGFSSALLASVLQQRHPEGKAPLVHTIDLKSRYLADESKAIGFEIPDLIPHCPDAVYVHVGRQSDFVAKVAQCDELAFVFVDADHQHPWPLLDLLRVVPFVRNAGWIILHDIQLGTMGARATQKGEPLAYGAPFGAEWLFDKWPFPKINGGNIGAVQLPRDKTQIIPTALKLMALPFEMDISSHRRMRHALFQSLLKLTKRERPKAQLGRALKNG